MFFKNLIRVFTSNMLGQALGFLSVLIISRALGPEDYGVLSILMGIQYITAQISSYGFSVSVPKIISGNLKRIKTVIRFLFVFRFLCIVITSLLLSTYLNTISYLDSEMKIIVIIGFVCNSIYIFSLTINQSLKMYGAWSVLNILNNLLKLLTVVIIMLSLGSLSVEIVLVVIAMIQAVLGMISFFHCRKVFYPSLTSIKTSKKIIKMSSWVFLSSIAVSIMMRIDVLMLGALSSVEDAGIYSVANQIALIFSLITVAVNTVLLPSYSNLIKDVGAVNLRNRILSFWPIIPIAAASSYLIAPIILKFFGSEFSSSITPLIFLIISFSFGLVINPISLIFYELNKEYILTYLNYGQLGLNVLLNYLMIPEYGVLGAAATTLIVRAVGAIFIYVASGYYVKQNF